VLLMVHRSPPGMRQSIALGRLWESSKNIPLVELNEWIGETLHITSGDGTAAPVLPVVGELLGLGWLAGRRMRRPRGSA